MAVAANYHYRASNSHRGFGEEQTNNLRGPSARAKGPSLVSIKFDGSVAVYTLERTMGTNLSLFTCNVCYFCTATLKFALFISAKYADQ